MTPSLRVAGPADRELLERFWLLFRHDMSAFTGALPFPDGSFRRERLDAALTDDDWCAYLLYLGEAPVGMALVRSLGREPRVLNSFFVVHGARRNGTGTWGVREVVRRHPGRWEVAFQEANDGAATFWRAVAASLDPAYVEEQRPIPGRPELPADSWIAFTVDPGGDAD
ncbi:GNAT family N-acetyltransferase [Luteipulveratus mongoliensis]|uniref:Acetyltransferase n=1 Tax=Luteipulveratus mongoliensis TaxID=571913 RepID=A0A0K1JHI5_9MICO|nr:acetyltransferase [Luteipulveratus mongoliensis]AKU16048.1 acetyltransferase [Luteipulveratus mongoliensis]